MMLMQYISRLKAEPRVIGTALTWVALMFFFTYTDLVVALCKSGDTFAPAFLGLQLKTITMFVNLGLIVMLLFDFTSKNNNISNVWVWTIIIGVFTAIAVYFHCIKVVNQTHKDFVFPLNCDWFGIVLFTIFLIMIFVLKTYTEFSNPIPVTQRSESK